MSKLTKYVYGGLFPTKYDILTKMNFLPIKNFVPYISPIVRYLPLFNFEGHSDPGFQNADIGCVIDSIKDERLKLPRVSCFKYVIDGHTNADIPSFLKEEITGLDGIFLAKWFPDYVPKLYSETRIVDFNSTCFVTNTDIRDGIKKVLKQYPVRSHMEKTKSYEVERVSFYSFDAEQKFLAFEATISGEMKELK